MCFPFPVWAEIAYATNSFSIPAPSNFRVRACVEFLCLVSGSPRRSAVLRLPCRVPRRSGRALPPCPRPSLGFSPPAELCPAGAVARTSTGPAAAVATARAVSMSNYPLRPAPHRLDIAELTLLSRHLMSAVGLLVAGGSGDDLREHGSHDARGGRMAGTREKFLLAERWIRGESFVYESRHGRSRPPGQRSRG